MNLQISGRHVEVTPALREYVTNKMERINRHFDQVINIEVVLTVENNNKEKDLRQRAECSILVKGNDIYATSSSSDMYASIDDLMDKLDRQITRYKERVQDHAKDAGKRVATG